MRNDEIIFPVIFSLLLLIRFGFYVGKENKKKKKEKTDAPKSKDQKKAFDVIEMFPQVKKSKPKPENPPDKKNVKKEPASGKLLISVSSFQSYRTPFVIFSF